MFWGRGWRRKSRPAVQGGSPVRRGWGLGGAGCSALDLGQVGGLAVAFPALGDSGQVEGCIAGWDAGLLYSGRAGMQVLPGAFCSVGRASRRRGLIRLLLLRMVRSQKGCHAVCWSRRVLAALASRSLWETSWAGLCSRVGRLRSCCSWAVVARKDLWGSSACVGSVTSTVWALPSVRRVVSLPGRFERRWCFL